MSSTVKRDPDPGDSGSGEPVNSADGDATSADATSARRHRWHAHRVARREDFVEAAIRAISAQGADVGINEIAAEAGVTKPVIYRHFTDKADLYLAVGERGTEMLVERLIPALVGDGSPWERIRGALDAYYLALEDFPDLYRFVVRGTFPGAPLDRNVVEEDKTRFAGVLADLLRAYMAAFQLPNDAADPWAYAIVGMAQSSGDWWLDHPGSMSRERLVENMTIVLWGAIDSVLKTGNIELDPHAPLTLPFSADLIIKQSDREDGDDHDRA
jgi:AcrR family transcriptional regulator